MLVAARVGRGVDAVEGQAVLDLALAGAAKLRPMSLLIPPRTPGVVAARFQTLRPFSGSSTTARSLMVAETVGRSVSSTWALASTVTASVIAPTFRTAFVRTTWLVATSTPVALKGAKPDMVTVISYLPVLTNWML